MTDEEVCSFVVQTRGYLCLGSMFGMPNGHILPEFAVSGFEGQFRQPLVVTGETTLEDFTEQYALITALPDVPLPLRSNLNWPRFYRVATD